MQLAKKFIFILIVVFSTISIRLSCYSGDLNFFFKHLNIKDGLSQNSVYPILQDEKGFMWFGTEGGLNRYDGYTFKIFNSTGLDGNGLSNNRIRALLLDSDGDFWIGTNGGGLNKMDRKSEKFSVYLIDSNNPDSGENKIYSLFEDSLTNLWVGTYSGGLYKFDKKKESFEKILLKLKKNDTSLKSVNTIMEDKRGTLWIGTSGGLFKSKKGTSKFVECNFNDTKKNRINLEVYSLVEDSSGLIWIGTLGGILRYNADKEILVPIEFPWAKELEGYRVLTIYEDKQRNLWIGSWNGLYIISDNKSDYKRLMAESNKNTDLNSKLVLNIYEDRSGIIWIGTLNGLNILNSNLSGFRYVNFPGEYGIPSSSNWIVSFFEDSDKVRWIGKYNEGLMKIDTKNNSSTIYKCFNDDGTINNKSIFSITESDSNTLWLTTLGGGLWRFTKNSGRFKVYENLSGIKESIGHNTVTKIMIDKNEIFVSTNGGLNILNQETGKFRRYFNDPSDDNSISHNFCFWILKDSKGRYWVGTYGGGLNQFIRNEDRFIRYLNDKNDLESISSNFIYTIHETSDGILWIGSVNGGLIRFDPESAVFRNFSTKDGLSNNTVWDILEDNKGNLWLSTMKGISKFETKKKKFTNFHVDDGMHINFFEPSNAFKNFEGLMYFWGSNGIIYFRPEQIKKNTYIPNVEITSINKISSTGRSSEIFPDSENEIRFSYHDNIISFDFAALSYLNSKKNRFKYQLIGVSDSWVDLGTKHSVSFTNLNPGHYIFKVLGSNNDGIWNENATQFRFRITPPFWATWWFRSAFFILLLYLILYVHRTRMRRLRTKLKSDAEMERLFLIRKISEREKEIILLMLKGKKSKDIEDELFISYNTVKNHIANIYKKLEVDNRTQFINIFKKLNLFD